MGLFAKGSVVVVPFPFSNLARAKVRPAVVLADVGLGDYLLCQVTSNPLADPGAIKLEASDFRQGGLRLVSYVRPGKLFTAHKKLIVSEVGQLQENLIRKIITNIVELLNR